MPQIFFYSIGILSVSGKKNNRTRMGNVAHILGQLYHCSGLGDEAQCGKPYARPSYHGTFTRAQATEIGIKEASKTIFANYVTLPPRPPTTTMDELPPAPFIAPSSTQSAPSSSVAVADTLPEPPQHPIVLPAETRAQVAQHVSNIQHMLRSVPQISYIVSRLDDADDPLLRTLNRPGSEISDVEATTSWAIEVCTSASSSQHGCLILNSYIERLFTYSEFYSALVGAHAPSKTQPSQSIAGKITVCCNSANVRSQLLKQLDQVDPAGTVIPVCFDLTGTSDTVVPEGFKNANNQRVFSLQALLCETRDAPAREISAVVDVEDRAIVLESDIIKMKVYKIANAPVQYTFTIPTTKYAVRAAIYATHYRPAKTLPPPSLPSTVAVLSASSRGGFSPTRRRRRRKSYYHAKKKIAY